MKNLLKDLKSMEQSSTHSVAVLLMPEATLVSSHKESTKARSKQLALLQHSFQHPRIRMTASPFTRWPSTLACLCVCVALAQSASLTARGLNGDEDRYSKLSISFEKGGCKFPCDLLERVPTYYDGWYDSTGLTGDKRSLAGHELVLGEVPTPAPSSASSGAKASECPESLTPVGYSRTRGFVLLVLLPPAFEDCKLSTLSRLAKSANAAALLVAQKCLGVDEDDSVKGECLGFKYPLDADDVRPHVQKDFGVPEIPVVLLSRSDARRYESCILGDLCVAGTELLVRLEWMRPKEKFEWTFWEPPQDIFERNREPVLLDDR